MVKAALGPDDLSEAIGPAIAAEAARRVAQGFTTDLANLAGGDLDAGPTAGAGAWRKLGTA